MPADPSEVQKMLASLSRDGQRDIDQAWNHTRAKFAKANRAGGGAMWRSIEAEFLKVVRETADRMAAKTRGYCGDALNGADQLVDDELQRFIRWIIQSYFSGGADASFEPDLVRVKDAAVADLRNMRQNTVAGPSISFRDVHGNVNIAAAQGSTANQAVKGASVADITGLIEQVKYIVESAQIDEAQRFELQHDLELLEMEATKPAPHEGKLIRCAKRLGETVERVGVAAAGPVATAILKHFGG